jgi:hypothetical protein
MSKTVTDYQNLITSEHQDKPNFLATIAAVVALPVQVQALMQSMMEKIFDLDQHPVGDQLDIIGQWVGVSRIINDSFSNLFFSWDDTDQDGWDFGIWRADNNPTAIVSLPDDVYLTLIRARIAANHWNGTTTEAYAIWRVLFPQFTLLIMDLQNMSFSVAIQGQVPDSLTESLLVGGYLPLKPEGVLIFEYFIPVNTGPLFGFDMETDSVKGWDEGSWAKEIGP